MRLSGDIGPKIAATRSKLAAPTSPQLRPPTTRRMVATRSRFFIGFLLRPCSANGCELDMVVSEAENYRDRTALSILCPTNSLDNYCTSAILRYDNAARLLPHPSAAPPHR